MCQFIGLVSTLVDTFNISLRLNFVLILDEKCIHRPSVLRLKLKYENRLVAGS